MAFTLFYFLAPMLIAQDVAPPVVPAQRPAAKSSQQPDRPAESQESFETGYSGHFACRSYSGVNRKLAMAVSDQEPELVAKFLGDGADVNARSDAPRRMTLLQTAAQYDWGAESIRLLLAAEAKVDLRDAFGDTVLIIACQNERGPDLAVVRLLIEAGADVNASGAKGRTPLMYAALCDKKTDVVELLLKSSAEVSARDRMGWTALMHACRRREENVDAVRMLMRAGAVVNDRHREGGTPLSIAAYFGQTQVAELLVASGANVNTSDTAKWTPLLCSALNGHLQIVDLLIRSGANVRVADRLGRTPLTMARISKNREVEKRLVAAGAR